MRVVPLGDPLSPPPNPGGSGRRRVLPQLQTVTTGMAPQGAAAEQIRVTGLFVSTFPSSVRLLEDGHVRSRHACVVTHETTASTRRK